MAVKKKPPVYVPAAEGDGLYVKLPLPAEVVTALQEHAANANRIVELFTGGAVPDLLAHIQKTGAALERDAVKIRAFARKRRRRAR